MSCPGSHNGGVANACEIILACGQLVLTFSTPHLRCEAVRLRLAAFRLTLGISREKCVNVTQADLMVQK